MTKINTIKVYHFHNGSGGGVLSVLRNLIMFSQNDLIENHIIYTINKNEIPDYIPEEIANAKTQQIFYYNPINNFYYTFKQLAKLLPNDKALIVAHDWLELGMASNLGLQNPVVQFLHGGYNYYYDLAQKHISSIDKFICVSPVIFKTLTENISSNESAIHQCYFAVPHIKYDFVNNEVLNIFYAVRDLEDANKNFKLLVTIDEMLKNNAVNVHWTIVGKVSENSNEYKFLLKLRKYVHFPSLSNEDLIFLLNKMNVFLLPSQNEGLPVALVEAMKAGLVPLTTNWNNATIELLIDGENGYHIELDNALAYAEKIKFLDNNRNILNEFSKKASQKANELFDPFINTRLIEDVYINVSEGTTKNKKPLKVYGSRLDCPLIPNFITSIIRQVPK